MAFQADWAAAHRLRAYACRLCVPLHRETMHCCSFNDQAQVSISGVGPSTTKDFARLCIWASTESVRNFSPFPFSAVHYRIDQHHTEVYSDRTNVNRYLLRIIRFLHVSNYPGSHCESALAGSHSPRFSGNTTRNTIGTMDKY